MLKRTKIVATVSDLKCEPEFIENLYKEGVNAIRLNTAHQGLDDTLRVIKIIRKVSEKIPIIVDTKGPEVRTNKFEEAREFKKGEKVYIVGGLDKKHSVDTIAVSYEHFEKEVPVGNKILIDDGAVGFEVLEKTKKGLLCKILNNGSLISRKSVNIPGVHIDLPSLTDKDREYVKFCAEHDVEFIAHSFVRSKEDVLEIQKILDKHKGKTKIIAKIENQEGVDKLDEILENVYAVMVARGDLGIEIPAERIPGIQKMMIEKCISRRRPVIVATQMLHTMMKNPFPTRAEISDIANAIYDGADAIMLSGETAYGDYPIEAVQTMTRVAFEVEKDLPAIRESSVASMPNEVSSYLAKSAVRACTKLPIRAIITESLSGRTARYLSAFRGKQLIFTQCYSKRLMRELALSWGVYSAYLDKKKQKERFVNISLKKLIETRGFKKDDLVVVLAGNFGDDNEASFVEISDVQKFMSMKNEHQHHQ